MFSGIQLKLRQSHLLRSFFFTYVDSLEKFSLLHFWLVDILSEICSFYKYGCLLCARLQGYKDWQYRCGLCFRWWWSISLIYSNHLEEAFAPTLTFCLWLLPGFGETAFCVPSSFEVHTHKGFLIRWQELWLIILSSLNSVFILSCMDF